MKWHDGCNKKPMDYVSYNDYEQRTAGQGVKPKTIQAWKTKKAEPLPSGQNDIIANLEKAQKGQVGRFDTEVRTAALAYAPQGRVPSGVEGDFKFGDVIDMVNPLHHLPLVGMAYRGLTNDTINPISQIVGGAVYGGPVGAITGTVNAIAKIQTGQDVGDHVMEFAGIKNDRNLDDVVMKYQKADLDNMPKPEKIRTITLNS